MTAQNPDIRRIQAAFFYAMAAEYASVRPQSKANIVQIPGLRLVAHDYGDLRIIDICIDEKRSGTRKNWTVISQNRTPLWCRRCVGTYKPDVVPFLNECLGRAAVQEMSFHGGRGPSYWTKGRLVYKNEPVGTFSSFRGHEAVQESGRLLCHSFYEGRLLV